MARRRSKWRKTWMLLKKMMQEARKTRAKQSLHQCPVCGNPYSLSIEMKEDKWTGIKTAFIRCSACGFEMTMENLPSIADEFWVYAKVLDAVQSQGITAAATTSASVSTTETAEQISEEGVVEESETEEGTEEELHIEVKEVGEEQTS